MKTRLNSLVITLSCISILLLISACAVGPDYRRPDTIVPVDYKEAPEGWKFAEPQDDIDRGLWWEIFNDEQLNAYEAQLNIANQNIATAIANYEQSRALVDAARAGFYPLITASAAAARQKQGGAGGSSFISTSSSGAVSSGSATTGAGAASVSPISNSHAVVANGSWEPDIWGLVRRTVEASAATAQANAALAAATRLSMQTTLAQDYFTLRTLDADQKLLDETVIAYQKSLTLTQHRYAAGVAALTDVVQARSQLQIAQAQAIGNGIARAQFEHAIAVLIGQPPATFAMAPNPLKAKVPRIPVEVPSALLERRPDIAQAERLMAAANAQIGVAIAAYFPTLTLTGNANIQGRGLSHWLSLPTLGWAISSQLAETIYEGGLRNANVRAARAAFDASVASYRQTVLTAFQNVEDSLSALRILKQETIVQDKAAASAKLALKLVTNQYRAGTTDYLSVFVAQTVAFGAERTAIDVKGQEMVAAVGLVAALGGGWDAVEIEDAAG